MLIYGNRRRFERYDVHCEGKYLERNVDDEIISQGNAKIVNLSESGALLEIQRKLDLLENVQIHLHLTTGVLKCDVDVIDQTFTESDSCYLRVKFKDLSLQQQEDLLSFLCDSE